MTSPAAQADVLAIHVPREIVNADSVYVVKWWTDDAASIDAGASVCDIETSKAVVTLEAEQGGYVRQTAAVGAEVAVGGVLGYITAAPDTPLPTEAPRVDTPASVAGDGGDRISAKARRKIVELGLDPALFTGQGVVREQDVTALAAQLAAKQTVREDVRGSFSVEPLSPIQRRVARVMESVTSVPVSYLERLVDLEAVRQRARALAAASGVVVTELDLLVAAVSSACRRHPRFNASFTTDQELRLYHQVNVGVAVDVQGDLFVVVVRDTAAKDEATLARELRGVQYLAQRRRAGVEHLSGGTITITSMLGRGVHRFAPIIYPEQTAIIGLADPEPGTTKAMLVLGFDHRASNGSDAAAFLQDVAAFALTRDSKRD